MKWILYLVICLSFLNFENVDAQSAKRFFNDAKMAEANNNIDEAIDFYSKSIMLDVKYFDAFVERGKCYQIKFRSGDALNDFRTAILLNPEVVEPLQLAANNLETQANFSDAYIYYKKITELKRKRFDIFQKAAWCQLNLKNFSQAIIECNKSIAIQEKSALSYLYRAMANDSLMDKQTAYNDYLMATSLLEKDAEYVGLVNKSNYVNYYIGLGNAHQNNNFSDLALVSFSKAIEINPNSSLAFLNRGKVFTSKMKLNDAEKDFNQSIVLNDKDYNSFNARGFLYYKIGEFEKAMSDYNKSISLNTSNPNSFKGKAECLEALNKIQDAEILYKKAFQLAMQNPKMDASTYETLLKNCTRKVFESLRESNAPTIKFKGLDNDKLQIIAPKNTLKINLVGNVIDASKIEKILIGDIEATYNKDEINPAFSVDVNVVMRDEIEVFVSDVYGNELKSYYKIIRTEKDAPKLTINQPITTNGFVVNLPDTAEFKLKIVGKVSDESTIKSININGVNATYNSKELNPEFSVDIDIAGIDSIKIILIDDFNNSNLLTYTLKRGNINNSAFNPMGKTWCVFIDNAKYSQLPMLEASSNDVLSMKNALQSYNIEKTIVKNDMTKNQMVTFFTKELHDLINENKVSSIMIFYAGHGKFINENGYWLPIDANKKDEQTFFNVSALKTYLSTYKTLTHSLVVSDACETGPAFYLAMRDANKLPECGQWEAAKKKSAQVLTSTTIDLNDDKSVFTKLFVSALKECNDKCISIEKITDKIAKRSVQYQKPKPKLGVIPALNNDDDATFFFVKK